MSYPLRAILAAFLLLVGSLFVQAQTNKEGQELCSSVLCGEVGRITKCEGEQAVTEGQTVGSCTEIESFVKTGEGGKLITCTITKFKTCTPPKGQVKVGCPRKAE